MKTEDWQKVNEIVLDALDLEPARRPEFVVNRSEGNQEIRHEVESLLANETAAKAADFFGSSAVVNYASFFDREEDSEALAGQEGIQPKYVQK